MKITFIKLLNKKEQNQVLMKHLREDNNCHDLKKVDFEKFLKKLKNNILKNKNNKFLKRNQAVLVAISLMLVTAGYLNYTNNIKEAALGDAQLVSSEVKEEAEIQQNEVIKEDDYFAKTKLEREKMYSQMLETYQKILENSQIQEEQKKIASTEIKNINNKKQAISTIENLLNGKDFKDSLIMINDNNIDVVIKNENNISKEQAAQIKNIVSRELKANIEDIHITTHA